MHPARRAWTHVEPIHAIVYFAPEKRAAYEQAGLRGGWMGYFASRAAAMGAVDAPVVAATFQNFAPAMVARAIPDAWRYSSPARCLAARHAAVDGALRRLWGAAGVDAPAVAEAAEMLGRVAARAVALGVAGRPLFAAHAALPVPPEPQLALWHWCTVLREHRFDGHVAASLAAGFDGCETLVTGSLTGVGPGAEPMREVRGWTAEQWLAAERRLRDRGLLGDEGLTGAGRAARAAVEERTDELAWAPWTVLSHDEVERLLGLLRPLVEALAGPEGITYPNYMGVPEPA